MKTIQVVEEARNSGAIAALRELQRLRVDQTRRIEIFDIIESQGLWLMFEPLESVLGIYLSTPTGAGILVNTYRPRGMQRLTAAHEYGHHVLGHGGSIDRKHEITGAGSSRSLSEVAAQGFALAFLMPPTLVNSVWQQLGLPLDANNVQPKQVYKLSLRLGASYIATLYSLVRLGKLDPGHAEKMLKLQPKSIKQQIKAGHGPSDSLADVWPIEDGDDGSTVTPVIGDEIWIDVPESPSTGFVWTAGVQNRSVRAASNDPTEILQPTQSLFLPGSAAAEGQLTMDTAFGSSGRRLIGFRALSAGQCNVTVILKRQWESDQAPERKLQVGVQIETRPTGEAERGLSQQARENLARAA
jgi:Zn-dependent peptidase ImmA (M78 family)/predicted secreted protein